MPMAVATTSLCRSRSNLDPTGCGDAYRSGLLYGIANGYDWEKTGRWRP
jgi:sugar/nucleoside kinase (ribokinase family)